MDRDVGCCGRDLGGRDRSVGGRDRSGGGRVADFVFRRFPSPTMAGNVANRDRTDGAMEQRSAANLDRSNRDVGGPSRVVGGSDSSGVAGTAAWAAGTAAGAAGTASWAAGTAAWAAGTEANKDRTDGAMEQRSAANLNRSNRDVGVPSHVVGGSDRSGVAGTAVWDRSVGGRDRSVGGRAAAWADGWRISCFGGFRRRRWLGTWSTGTVPTVLWSRGRRRERRSQKTCAA